MKYNAIKFFQDNSNKKYTPPELPKNLSVIESARWIMNNDNFAYLKLDLKINPIQWSYELGRAEPYYVHHRESNSEGWMACCLHGIRTDTTLNWPEYVEEEKDGIYNWTEIEDKVPIISSFWKYRVPHEKYKRVRFMKLEPQGYIEPHSDAPGSGYIPGETVDYDPLEQGFPINVAVSHPDSCYMTLENFGTIPFQEGDVYLINIRHKHSVWNTSDKERIHMIGFIVPGNKKQEVAELIVRSYLQQ
jgi:hypothetical protein